MAFEPIRSDLGQPRLRCICDGCGRAEVVAAIHGKDGHEGEGQAIAKLQRMGWTFIGKRLRCLKCAAKRKHAKMPNDTENAAAADASTVAPPEPSRAQKREIMDLLGEVYDSDAECYRRGDTDETVAAVLEVRAGWVAKLREEFFGAAGANEDMQALANEVADYLKTARQKLDSHSKVVAMARDDIAKVEAYAARLNKIEAAVGRRILDRVPT